MFVEMALFDQFMSGTMTALGHSFGTKFMPWVVKCWRWAWNRKGEAPAELSNSEALLSRVTVEDLASGIPDGYQVCRYKNGNLLERYLDEPPKEIEADETLWLVPTDAVVVSTGFAAGDSSTTAEVEVEFDPADGLFSLLTDGQELNRGWLEGLIAGGLIGAIASIGKPRAMAFIKGDSAATDGCREHLNTTFKNRGIRCTSVRPSNSTKGVAQTSGSSGSSSAVPLELSSELEKIRTAEDWKRLVESLRLGGVPFDNQTTQQIDDLRNQLLAKTIEPSQAVTGLARLTADAFERAGITQPDLQRWQTISDRLADVNPDGAEDDVKIQPANVEVATSKRPSNWLVWNRSDVDQRQLRYTRQSVRHCRGACDQALASLRDMPSLRQVRDLNEQFKLIEELLATIPKLDSHTASLRLDSQTVKAILKSLEDAVLTTERLGKELDQLFSQPPASAGWTKSISACSQLISRLSQLVRDRRAIR